jgi:predicted RNA methylase
LNANIKINEFYVDSPTVYRKILAKIIWDSLENMNNHPTINKNGAIYSLKKINSMYYLLLSFYKKSTQMIAISNNYPKTRPISIKPGLARACLNMLSFDSMFLVSSNNHNAINDILNNPPNQLNHSSRSVKIFDPFMGIGTFLIEAGSLGLFPIGLDNDYEMIKATRINLNHFNIKNYVLRLFDSTKISFDMEYVITDLPYGKNTKNISRNLYAKFFDVLSKHLKKRAVIIVRDPFEFNIIPKNLCVIATTTQYIHRNMTRRILIIERKSNKEEI